MRIFLGLTEVSGYYVRLQRGLSELGAQAEFFPLQDHRFGYGPTPSAWIPRFAQYCVRNRIGALKKSPWRDAFWLTLVVLSRVIFFSWALVRFDVFIMGGGSSFFRFRELRLMRLLGRRIIYTFHGTDSRPAWMDGFCQGTSRMSVQPTSEPFPTDIDVATFHRVNGERRDTVRRIERYANVVINAPPQAQLLSKPYVIGLAVGIPIDAAALSEPRETRTPTTAVRVLHSPSFHIGKGTTEIRAAIQRLQEDGIELEYTEISNRPHMEVRQAIAACDFVVDQVYSDSPMAGFAGEAALAGKPAVVCGYYSAHLETDLAPYMRPPSLYCHPEQLEDAIRLLAVDSIRRKQLGAEAKEFVEKHWSPRAVATRYLLLAKGEPVPSEWMYQPEQNRYFLGMGIDEDSLRKVLQQYLNQFGESALGIDAAPELKRRVLAFASQETP
jgi:hypothetical protein